MNPAPRLRWPYLVLAYACVGVGGVGVAVPGLPTVPFLLVAAWAASRGAPGLRARLVADPRFGPALQAWERERAIPIRARWSAVAMLALSAAVLYAVGVAPSVWLLVATVFLAVAVFILTRPVPGTGRRA